MINGDLRRCAIGNRCCIRIFIPVHPCAAQQFQFIRVGPTPAGFYPDARRLSKQGMKNHWGICEKWHISTHQSCHSPDLSRHACSFLWEQCWGKAARHRISVVAHCPVDLNSFSDFILGTNLCSKWLSSAFCAGWSLAVSSRALVCADHLLFCSTAFCTPSCSHSQGEMVARHQRWRQANEHIWGYQGEVRDTVTSGNISMPFFFLPPSNVLAAEIICFQLVNLLLQPTKYLPVLVNVSDGCNRKYACSGSGEDVVTCHGGKTVLLDGSYNSSPSKPWTRFLVWFYVATHIKKNPIVSI